MKGNLIPHFISDNFNKQKYSGRFKATTMFVDISGFTSMTQTLMQNGKEGAEILTEAINQVFTPAIAEIYKNKGFVSGFAGDSFTAIFPTKKSTIIKSLTAAKKIKTVFEKISLRKTKFGDFQLSAKIGLSHGLVVWRIINSQQQSSYYFHGEAINNCATSEHQCDSKEIVFDKQVLKALPNKKKISYYKKTANYYSLQEVKILLSAAKDSFSAASSENFIPQTIINLKREGEFREIISCFIAFQEDLYFDKHLSTIIVLTKQFGGYLNKIDFGDKGGIILVLFGAPTAKDKIFKRAADFALTVKSLNNSGFRTKIGLTFGTAFTGFIGSKQRKEYTAMGNVVNLSARFTMKATWNQIFISDKISTNINHVSSYLSKFKFKGFSSEIPVFLLLEKEKKLTKKSYKNDLIGRNSKLEQLHKLLQPIFNNKNAHMICIDGFAGIGKTRFIWELKKLLIKKFPINWFYLPCDEILKNSFNPIIYFLKNYFNFSENSTTEENKLAFEKKFNNLLEKITDKSLKTELQRTKSILAGFIGLQWENSLFSQLENKRRYENYLSSVKNLIKAESLLKPVIIELDDGHCIDADSKEFLENLMINTEDYPISVISACRLNDDESVFKFDFTHVKIKRLSLNYLSKEGTENLVSNILKTDKLALQTLKLIFEKSEGNPFFIEQITMYLKENELLDENFALKNKQFKIPSSINAVIIARIDRLRMELKEVIKTASVLGKEFAIKTLSKMLKNQPIEQHLSEGKEEVIWDVLNELKYIFKHTLIREAIYEMQLKKEVRELHKLAGEVIEKTYQSHLENYYGELANHFDKAAISEQAIIYAEKAGDHARDNYLNEQAIKFYQKLLTSEYQIPATLKAKLYTKKGKILKLIGKWDQAWSDFNSALTIFETIKNTKKIIKTLHFMATILIRKSDFDTALNYAKRQLNLSKQIKYDEGICNSYINLGNIFKTKNNNTKAMKNFQTALKFSDRCENPEMTSSIYGNIGYVLWNRSRYKEALKYYQKQLDISLKLNKKQQISSAYSNMGNIYKNIGNYDIAMDLYKKKLAISKKIGDKRGISIATGNMGIIYKKKGNYDKALEYYNLQLEISEELGDKQIKSIVLGNIGVIHKNKDNYDKALDFYLRKLKIAKEIKDRKSIAIANGNIGLLYSNQGRYTEALKFYQKQLNICRELGEKQIVSITLGNIGLLYQNQADYKKALDYFNQSLSIVEEIGAKWLLPHWYFAKAESLYNLKNYELAQEVNEKCHKTAVEMKNKSLIENSTTLSSLLDFFNHNDVTTKENIINNFIILLTKENNIKKKAKLNYDIAIMLHQLNKNNSEYKNRAIEIYKELYAKIPKISYKKRCDILRKINT